MRDQQRLEVLTRWIAGVLTRTEAIGLLGLSERSAWRLRRRLIDHGADGLVHGNRGRASPARLPEKTRARIVELAGPHGRYQGINDCYLAELLAEEEQISLSRSSLQRLLRSAGGSPVEALLLTQIGPRQRNRPGRPSEIQRCGAASAAPRWRYARGAGPFPL